MFGRIRALLGLSRDEETAGDGRVSDGEATETEPSDEGDGSVWDFIPGRQYSGRHAESGGIARGEQERALQDIERKAEIIENEGDHADPAVDRERR
ncbi:hypothetical protein BV210_07780 [Halorientalis sp. IM1011]|uniref:hypothetical protein n=1 Tax=Halorientalis sp. IM1011 TaxID=1932360 RepID=UPI00097CC795|nr:hypothetical protein [Halorientalis sp. IM1011]AQL42614.1 hypothetical protein BV210_07780 [Halorientalis sp. IM1011]